MLSVSIDVRYVPEADINRIMAAICWLGARRLASAISRPTTDVNLSQRRQMLQGLCLGLVVVGLPTLERERFAVVRRHLATGSVKPGSPRSGAHKKASQSKMLRLGR